MNAVSININAKSCALNTFADTINIEKSPLQTPTNSKVPDSPAQPLRGKSGKKICCSCPGEFITL
jgi:hypothetical protein